MKLLSLDEGGVHVRVYANQFKTKPKRINTDQLTLGNVHDVNFGVGHMPLSFETVASWQPEYIATQLVQDEDLEGLRLWEKEGLGNYF